MSERTHEAELRAVRRFAQHCKNSPGLISEEELRQYFCTSRMSRSTRANYLIGLCEIKFFVERTQGRLDERFFDAELHSAFDPSRSLTLH